MSSDPDSSDTSLATAPQFCAPSCNLCAPERDSMLYCVTCTQYLCKHCYVYHDINDYLNSHRVVFISEIAKIDDLDKILGDFNSPLNSDLVFRNTLKNQFAEGKECLDRMLTMSDFLRKQLFVLEKHRSESIRLICESHKQLELYLRSQRDQIITSLQNEYDSLKFSIGAKTQSVDDTVKEMILKLTRIRLMVENDGETASGFDMEMAARSGFVNGLYLEEEPLEGAGALPAHFDDGSGAGLADNHVIPSELPNLPVVSAPPNSKCHVNPDLSLSISDPDDILPCNNHVVNSLQLCKTFGQKGNGSGQFNSPHGFCIGFDEDIVVADSSNHRIQVFDKRGLFKFQFGVTGRHDGYLWHPRKVVKLPRQRCFVVCDRGYERSRMQVFTKEGKFYKKIHLHFIDIVAGVAVTDKEQIIVVDSVTPTVFIVGENDFLRSLDCSRFMQEPSDVVTRGDEFFICDFKAHAIVVIDPDGNFLRKFGNQHTIMFPNGIDISYSGDVIVGDSHGNYFHVVIYSDRGDFIAEYRCPFVKVSRCCGLKITAEGRLVTVDKNYHHVIVFERLLVPTGSFS
ncbi:uncharacterized protein LOC123005492 [Tribolium madens]|uniref:uncharacterized protein LOC123005492 n=1 Tax=Tribolium madens TaxID=41895 RepID=UPI001CF73B0D|nr:uncharacterized protein LOC123005492 [Tribolium madens]XP_044255212.1 uncharacterized protein LOC123005492 [Tribolium madens]